MVVKCHLIVVTPFYSSFVIFHDSRRPGSLFRGGMETQSQGIRGGFLASVEGFAGGWKLSVDFPLSQGTVCFRLSVIFFS